MLVNDLLTLSRSDNSESTVRKENFNFDEILDGAVDAMKPVAVQNNISLQRNIPKPVSAILKVPGWGFPWLSGLQKFIMAKSQSKAKWGKVQSLL